MDMEYGAASGLGLSAEIEPLLMILYSTHQRGSFSRLCRVRPCTLPRAGTGHGERKENRDSPPALWRLGLHEPHRLLDAHDGREGVDAEDGLEGFDGDIFDGRRGVGYAGVLE